GFKESTTTYHSLPFDLYVIQANNESPLRRAVSSPGKAAPLRRLLPPRPISNPNVGKSERVIKHPERRIMSGCSALSLSDRGGRMSRKAKTVKTISVLCIALVTVLGLATHTNAQIYTDLHNFDCSKEGC